MKWILLLILVCSGCGEEHLQAELSDMKVRLDELNRYVTDAHVRIEELNNRVFLLQEQQASFGRSRPPAGLKKKRLVPKKEEEVTKEAAGNKLTSGSKNVYNQDGNANAPRVISNWPVDTGTAPGKKVSKRSTSKNEKVEKTYQEALEKHRNGEYEAAIKAFSEFLKKYADTSYGDNAFFWIGVSYFEIKKWDLAIKHFQKTLGFKDANKEADALYYIGLCYQVKNDAVKAAEYFDKVVRRYPDSEAAKKAEAQLKEQRSNP